MSEYDDPVVEEAARVTEPADALAEPDVLAGLLPALARLSVRMWMRGAAWSINASVRTGRRLARAAVDPDAATELVLDVRKELRGYAREFLGINEIDHQMQLLAPAVNANPLSRRGRRNGRVTDTQALRQPGAELLKQAADVYEDDNAHPAYARILTELAPDEARILRVLTVEGPQPLVDVRATNLIGIGSQLIGQGLNLVGASAGLRYRDRVPAYLNNLHRLGLIFLSDEPLPDPIAYQVLEAQPDVLDAIKEASRAKTVHRSIRLSPFGQDFCDVCLPVEIAEIEQLTAGE
jgi:Abortive infection alpha